jgi:Sulfotransferase domain
MRKPNFFILGAPKCGTTSLATWLGEHPNVFMSSYKEPHFFNTDDKRVVDSIDYYQSFFRGAGLQHRAIGEASVWYLSSTEAVRGILGFESEARFIVMLRSPVEMAPALHAEMLFTGMEDERDFATAWQLQAARRAGHKLPSSCSVPRRLFYADACSLGSQFERLLGMVPAHRVMPILLDDLRQNPRREYLRVLQFLEVIDDGRSDFAVKNAAKVRRWPFLVQLSRGVAAVRGRLGVRRGLGLWRRLDGMNRLDQRRQPLSPEFERTLKRYFAADVARLGRLLNRDLECWTAC